MAAMGCRHSGNDGDLSSWRTRPQDSDRNGLVEGVDRGCRTVHRAGHSKSAYCSSFNRKWSASDAAWKFSMILEIVTIHIKPGQEAAFEEAFKEASKLIAASDGYVS